MEVGTAIVVPVHVEEDEVDLDLLLTVVTLDLVDDMADRLGRLSLIEPVLLPLPPPPLMLLLTRLVSGVALPESNESGPAAATEGPTVLVWAISPRSMMTSACSQSRWKSLERSWCFLGLVALSDRDAFLKDVRSVFRSKG